MSRRAAPRPILGLLLVLAVSSSLARPALAAWPHDPYNGNLPLVTATNDQVDPAIVSDGAGGAFVSWNDSRPGTNSDIYVQRVSAAGLPLWTANGVALCTAGNSQFGASIVADGAGGAIISWSDLRSGTSSDVYAQRVNAAGVPQWTANGVALCTVAGDQNYPQITSDGAGGAIVTWTDYRGGTTADIYVQRVSAAGTPQWTANGVALCIAASDQTSPRIVSDGAGGAIVGWEDARSGPTDIYARRVNSAGVPQWVADGTPISVATSYQFSVAITADGSGGAILAWQDLRGGVNYDVYAQRVTAAGATSWAGGGVAICVASGLQTEIACASDGVGGAIIAWSDGRNGPRDVYASRITAQGSPQWTTDGVPLCTAQGNQGATRVVSDGSGGAIVSWLDGRAGAYGVYAQRVSGTGATIWNYDGAPLCISGGDKETPVIASDGAGGAIVTWIDSRGGDFDIYAQRIERYGFLGNPEPTIVMVKDSPNDQGGSLKVGWNASYLDVDPLATIQEYRVWRSAPPNTITAQALRSRGVTQDPDEAARRGRFLAIPESATSYLWELVARQPAFELPGYSVVTATTSDSLAASNPRTAFMVEAGTSAYPSTPHWFSAPDSGYSVDNIPPATPSLFTAAYAAGATHLHWIENHEADLAGYRLYRGSSAAFVPGPANLISVQPDTGFADAGPAGNWYKLAAADVHDNLSAFAVLGPNGTVDAQGPGAVALFFASPSPSPTSGGATFRFGLPTAGPVTLTLFDQQGRRVRELARGVMAAGNHQLLWDGRDDHGGPVPSGLYFARFDSPGGSRVARLVEIR